MRHKLQDSDIVIGQVYITPINGILSRVVVIGPGTLWRGDEPRTAWKVRRADLTAPLIKPRLAATLRHDWPIQGRAMRKARGAGKRTVRGVRVLG